ncbi:hypothetical protein [Rhodobacter sp. NSM]|uniref:hypothetical protein n=1 Tax=Rhodobacter sp. NSM TaxID=3457501 RepID=UPI003FD08F6B
MARVERYGSNIEVTYADGSREEIEGGIYERKDSSRRTVEERPATRADYERLAGL